MSADERQRAKARLLLYPPRQGSEPIGRLEQVLKGIAEGMSTKEIAWKLHVSPKTVEYHRDRIRQRLNLPSVAHMTQFALKYKLADWIL